MLEYLKLENGKAERFMKMVRLRERSLNTALKIADEVLRPLLEVAQTHSVWDVLPHDDYVRHFATLKHLQVEKNETVEDVMGKTMRSMSESGMSSTFNQFNY
jgi:hypothetical protein